MKTEKRDSILGRYLRQYWKGTLVFGFFVGIFAFIFSLYNLEVEAVWYAAGLCALAALVILTVHFGRYRRRHLQRMRVLQDVPFLLDQLPEPRTLAEADDQKLLRACRDILDANLTSWQNERRESMDYYTTWVHQIKTPISAMYMLLQQEDTEEHRALAAELFRIEQYVEMVLSYLRLGSGASDFLFQTYDLHDVIIQAVHKYAPQFVRNRVRLTYEPVHAAVVTDEKWLLFILEQLLSNAVKYTPAGSVTIAVLPGPLLRISDTGIGIAPEDLPRIFEKGFTGYNGRIYQKSTGLGLYLCRLTADRLSHKISVESTVGVGTSFTLDLRRDALEVE